MTSQPIAGYVLHVDGKAAEVGQSLKEAKRLAEKYIAKTHTLRIESAIAAVAVVQTQIWNYDYGAHAWVERK